MVTILLILALSYLAGSIPTSVIVARRAKGIDIRQHGSGNAGGTNVLRVVGWKAALLVAVVDVGKGALAAGLISRLRIGVVPLDDLAVASLAGVAAVIGHVYPVFAGFRGGKGVGTAAGVLLVLYPLALALCLPAFILLVYLTRMVSLASISSAFAVPIALLALKGTAWAGENILSYCVTLALAFFILFTHRANVVRIFQGTENRFGVTKPAEKGTTQ